ncbi:hypothetical protein CcaverHIS002_0103280 [Cutaneotrichosporon cavernicola]|uniref:Major facilitator superfamily (MFS) profile domain-containing protein n=1 Tax=Cutaneotrichosporon cavernicola TaxID=279322 RepID=A0AA48KWW6_9TREE|nr:uncharacterized protein CcaverHIS019_0103220 [Cutaneotrichosporon cavernicola]BEI79799.1 hypothetical protein CcaverHIS002_0103280 [Cutaneotrichosporon cavernicola]BEI87604.1 hypothetical protein CcaverHIS019_0103220 [Cutaneotrichosporon cavernicola]BEI95375.1 hypothetical protein CcaverHIS631_0103240 [Cutaneotrichosporon cavernicola]BEJ03149.1 hypothetical protein CcaverHIS641_0103240 [Cutaneotrichosporon cavernicola]
MSSSPYPDKPVSQRTSQATLTNSLPDGCSYGSIPGKDESAAERVIWVDFPPDSRDNPFYFSTKRKVCITMCALIYCWYCSMTASAFAIQSGAMCEDLHCPHLGAEAGIGLYAWGAGVMPLFVAPVSEEFGRRPVYLCALFMLWMFHLMQGLAQNTATALIARFLTGIAGSVGTSVVGGTVADIFTPAHRGLPMMMTGFILYFSTGFGGMIFAFVTTHLGWRWTWWLILITLGACAPLFVFLMPETRGSIILRRRAKKLRQERGLNDGGRYLSHGEMNKVRFLTALKTSMIRPIIFLLTEPIVMFFSLWVALAWSVMYVQIAGLPYMMRTLYGFSTEQVGLVYLTACIGACFGYLGGYAQEFLYRRYAPTKGVEARLYTPMVAGVLFALGCFITGATASADIPWIASAIGQVVVITGVMIIYVTAFTYVSECYGTYASSAMASQSFLRNMVGGGIAFGTTSMFKGMTVRWALILMGGIASLLALVPFVAYYYGPAIRERSPYSRELMRQEREALDSERVQRELRGMDMTGAEDIEGDVYEKERD